MHVPRHAAPPRPSRLKLLLWLSVITLWSAARLTDHAFHPAWIGPASDAGAGLTLLAGMSARRLRTLKFRRIQAAAPGQYELLTKRQNRCEEQVDANTRRLDELERAWDLVHGPPARPDLTVLKGGRS